MLSKLKNSVLISHGRSKRVANSLCTAAVAPSKPLISLLLGHLFRVGPTDKLQSAQMRKVP